MRFTLNRPPGAPALRMPAHRSSARAGRLRAVAAGGFALLGFAPEASPRLDVEPGVLADDPCLSPSFDQPGCAAGAASGRIETLPSASAALLPWDMALPEPQPLLAFDKGVLEASVEVTFSCPSGGCPPGATAGTD